MLKIKNKNNYETKVTTIDGYCGTVYEENKDNYNCLLKQKEQFEYIMSKQVDYQGQQKEFIKWLENGIEKVKNTEFLDERIQRAGLIAYNRCLQKYKNIIGVSDESR